MFVRVCSWDGGFIGLSILKNQRQSGDLVWCHHVTNKARRNDRREKMTLHYRRASLWERMAPGRVLPLIIALLQILSWSCSSLIHQATPCDARKSKRTQTALSESSASHYWPYVWEQAPNRLKCIRRCSQKLPRLSTKCSTRIQGRTWRLRVSRWRPWHLEAAYRVVLQEQFASSRNAGWDGYSLCRWDHSTPFG